MEGVSRFNRGCFVWARNTKVYWPAIIISKEDALKRIVKPGHTYVYWFGDKRISEVKISYCHPFGEDFVMMYRRFNTKAAAKWFRGVNEALKIYFGILDPTIRHDELMNRAWREFVDWDDAYEDKILQDLPEQVKIHLTSRKYIQWKPYETSKFLGNISKYQNLFYNDLCIGCFRRNVYGDHPLFDNKVCDDCYDKLLNTTHVKDETGKYKFCTICGNTTKLIYCSVIKCQRAFCAACMRHVLNIDTKKEDIICMFCNVVKRINNITVRPNWIFILHNYFFPGCEIKHLKPRSDSPSILIVFFGTPAGFSSLKNLKYKERSCFEIKLRNNECYANYYHLYKVGKHLIYNMRNIQCIFGGTSVTNMTDTNKYKSPTMDIFWEFFRIVNIFLLNENQSVFWFFEASVLSNKCENDAITHFLSQNPVLVLIGTNTYKLVWTNMDDVFQDM